MCDVMSIIVLVYSVWHLAVWYCAVVDCRPSVLIIVQLPMKHIVCWRICVIEMYCRRVKPDNCVIGLNWLMRSAVLGFSCTGSVAFI